MAKNLLEQLREVTIVVADTGDIQAIEKFQPRDATTNPSLITAAAQMPQYQEIVDGTLKTARQELGTDATASDVANLAFKRLAVAFGLKILQIVHDSDFGEDVLSRCHEEGIIFYLICLFSIAEIHCHHYFATIC